MPASLLPDHAAGADSTAALEAIFPGWPAGHPDARLVHEYLVGRSTGMLDISGRPVPEAAATFQHLPPLVLDDPDGALSAVLAVVTGTAAEAYCDSLTAERRVQEAAAALAASASVQPTAAITVLEPGGPHLARLLEAAASEQRRVVISAPKAIAGLREYLEAVSTFAAEVIVVGRIKHLTPAINSELAGWFARVDVSPALAKSRLIIGSQPYRAPEKPISPSISGTSFPVTNRIASPAPGVPDLEVAAHGACFSGAKADPGTALLLSALATRRTEVLAEDAFVAEDSALAAEAPRILDLGCGNGWLLACLGRLFPRARLSGTDVSKAALASAAETCRKAGRYAQLWLSDAGDTFPEPADEARQPADGARPGFDLIVLNPPFHAGHAVETGTAQRMIERSTALLVPGGRLVCVFNSHLRYRRLITRVFGNSEQWARDHRFTVVSARAC